MRIRTRYPLEIKLSIIADLPHLNSRELAAKYGYTPMQMSNFRANLTVEEREASGLPKKRVYISSPPKTRKFEWRNGPTKKFDDPVVQEKSAPESFIRPPSKARLMAGK